MVRTPQVTDFVRRAMLSSSTRSASLPTSMLPVLSSQWFAKADPVV
jgi:hypothetical protein